MNPDQFPPWLRYSIVLTGLALVVYEVTLHHGPVRYSVLIVATGMMGIPSLLGIDLIARRHETPDDEDPHR